MERDAISVNVGKGGLKSTAEIKVLVLYLLMHTDEPVPSNQIADLLHIEMIANTFEVNDAFVQLHKNGLIDKVFTTNLIYNPPELLEREWYCNVNMSKYIALLVDTINCDNSISGLLDPADKIHAVVAKHEGRT